MSKRKKIWAAIALAAAIFVLFPLSLRWHLQWQLHAYRQKLIASGKKLTIAELAPEPNFQSPNTARFLRAASAAPSFGDYSASPALPIKPGVARVAWRQSRCLERMDMSNGLVDVWPALADLARKNAPSLHELQELLGQGGIGFADAPNLNYTHLILSKKIETDCSSMAMLALHQGQRQEAFEYLKASGDLSQLLANDPSEISQLVMYACMAIQVGDFWEALQAGGWTDEQLAQWQRQWEQNGILDGAEATLSMQCARAPILFKAARASRAGLADLTGGEGLNNFDKIREDSLLNAHKGINELADSYPRYWGWKWIWSYRDERNYLEVIQSTIESLRSAQKGRPAGSSFKARPAANAMDVAGSTAQSNAQFIRQSLRAQTSANIVAAAIALERFHLAHHAYPEALANLAPDFVQSVPVDCMDGRDLRYRLNPDGTYLLYSVGLDGADDGGDPSPEDGKKPGFRNGRDWVWPRAATDREVRDFEAPQSGPKKRRQPSGKK